MNEELKNYLEEQFADLRRQIHKLTEKVDRLCELQEGSETEMIRTKPALPLPKDVDRYESRRKVGRFIKRTLSDFKVGVSFSTRDVFEAMPDNDWEYERIRTSISAWLHRYVKEGELEKVSWGEFKKPEEMKRTK